ncbi:MAG: urease accessory UreF family protein [Limisphaerales bacterium]
MSPPVVRLEREANDFYMVKQTNVVLSDAAEWLGDWHPLAEQLGSADGLLALGSVSNLLQIRPVQDVASLRSFLRSYHDEVLAPVELPAIRAAFQHAERNEVRELIGLDEQLTRAPLLGSFAEPSRRVGQAQLQKLRPLRDQRLVQRYLSAVDEGLAQGWHTLVYGVTLVIYSLPLRQGLLGYAQQTMRGFIYSGARMLRLSERQCRELFDEINPRLSQTVQQTVDLPTKMEGETGHGAQ